MVEGCAHHGARPPAPVLARGSILKRAGMRGRARARYRSWAGAGTRASAHGRARAILGFDERSQIRQVVLAARDDQERADHVAHLTIQKSVALDLETNQSVVRGVLEDVEATNRSRRVPVLV